LNLKIDIANKKIIEEIKAGMSKTEKIDPVEINSVLDELDNEFTNWFDVYTYDQTVAPITDYHPVTVTGNFTWIRARVTAFEAGTIDDITVSY
jgi:hypothetical protein